MPSPIQNNSTDAQPTPVSNLHTESSLDAQSLFVGRTTLDVLYRLDRLPDEDTKVYARNFHAAPGGPALNAAITHALLGGHSTLVSAVGYGPWAAAVRAELDRLRIRLIDIAADTPYQTPFCTALLNAQNGSRTVINPPLTQIPFKHLNSNWNAEKWGKMPSLVLTDGFHFAETAALLTTFHNAGIAICLDGGSWKPGTDDLATLLTIAICSERFSVPGINNTPDATFAWFAAKGVPHIAITRGAKSILGWDRGRRFEIEIPAIRASDTLGAGDVLHGAFCYHFSLNHLFESALRQAANVATLSCQSMGIQAWAAQLRDSGDQLSISPSKLSCQLATRSGMMGSWNPTG
jgi:sugar/nucleoside kinase (ribokinase family)